MTKLARARRFVNYKINVSLEPMMDDVRALGEWQCRTICASLIMDGAYGGRWPRRARGGTPR